MVFVIEEYSRSINGELLDVKVVDNITSIKSLDENKYYCSKSFDSREEAEIYIRCIKFYSKCRPKLRYHRSLNEADWYGFKLKTGYWYGEDWNSGVKIISKGCIKIDRDGVYIGIYANIQNRIEFKWVRTDVIQVEDEEDARIWNVVTEGVLYIEKEEEIREDVDWSRYILDITEIWFGCEVRNIKPRSFIEYFNLKKVGFSSKLLSIGDCAFGEGVEQVYFTGSREQWDSVDKGLNESINQAYVYCMKKEKKEKVLK